MAADSKSGRKFARKTYVRIFSSLLLDKPSVTVTFSLIDISSISKWKNKPESTSLMHRQSKSNYI